MAKLQIVAGATSQSITIFIQNSASTTGGGLTGLTATAASLICYYTWSGTNTTATQATLAALASVGTAWASNGFIEIDSTHMPGTYRLDLNNTAIESGKGRSVVYYLSGASSMAPCVFEIELTAVDNQSTGFGLVDVSANAVQINGVSTSSVTTVNANIGETQPINFTGTAGSALVKVDVTDIATAAVNPALAQLGVNAVNIGGQAVALDANNLLKVDVEDVNGVASIETGVNLVGMLRVMGSTTAGLLTGAGTGTEVFNAVNATASTKTRVNASVDSSGNRTAITYTFTT